MKPLYDITPFTLLDYPGLPAAILWFSGCNLRCRYCYNPQIVMGEGRLEEGDALSFLVQRAGLLEGVVLSGGEATLYPNLVGFCRSIKQLGYWVKIDSNGMRSDVLEELLAEGLIDYVALDYKGPDRKMVEICGGGSENRFWESFDAVHRSGVMYEVRTTWHPQLLSSSDIKTMSKRLRKAGYPHPYYLQMFRSGVETLGGLEDSDAEADIDALPAGIILRT